VEGGREGISSTDADSRPECWLLLVEGLHVERIFPDLEQLGLTHSAAILAINATEKHSPPMPYDFASPTATEDQSESLPPEAAIVL
jgi:hypothetical protein